jgi:hypothetical protein
MQRGLRTGNHRGRPFPARLDSRSLAGFGLHAVFFGLDLLLLLLLKHRALAAWGWRLIDQISGEVLLGLVRQMQPSLRHLD